MKEGAISRSSADAGLGSARVVALLLVLAAATLFLRLSGSLNHDVAFTLIGAETLLDGGRFGIDVVDPNPPLSWWVAILPVALARLSGLGLHAAVSLFTIGLALASLTLTKAILVRSSLGRARRQLFIVAAAAVLLLAPGYDFGQREHLMLIGALPWAAAAGLAAERKRLPLPTGLALGICAGIAFCLKPHFLIVPVAIDLWLLLRVRDPRLLFRPEAWALAATGIVYAVAILFFAPDYLQSVVPKAKAVYWAFDGSSGSVFFQFAWVLLPILAGGLILGRGSSRISQLAAALIAASAGAFAAALLQHKGWNYHWLPGVGLAGMTIAALQVNSPRWRRPRLLVLAAGLLAISGVFGKAANEGWADFSGRGTSARVTRLAASIQAEGGSHASVFAFITSPRDVHPGVIASGARWTDPACCVQWLPAGIRADELDRDSGRRARAVAQFSRQALIHRLERDRPDLILIDDRPGKLGFGGRKFDYLPYLLASAEFRKFWAGYDERGRASGYRIFRRRG